MEKIDKNLSVEDIMLQGVRAKKEAEKPEVVEDPIIEPSNPLDAPVDPIIPEDIVPPVEEPVDPLKAKVEEPVEPAVEPKVEEPKIEEPKVQEDWDTLIVEDNEPKIDVNLYKELGNDLNLGDIATKEELLSKLTETQNKIADESGKKFDNIPDDLKRAIEVAELGGDYKSLMSEPDYSNVDPKAFFVEAAKEHFMGENGVLDTEALQDFVDTQDPKMIDIQGSTIKKQYVEQQEAKKEAIILQERKRKEQTEAKLKTALNDFNTYNEFKVNETHKKQLYEDITTGKAMKEMFYDKNGEYDMGKVINAYFHYLKGEQMESFRSQRAKNEALRDVIQDANNADLKVNGRKITTNAKVDRPDPFTLLAKSVGMIQDDK